MIALITNQARRRRKRQFRSYARAAAKTMLLLCTTTVPALAQFENTEAFVLPAGRSFDQAAKVYPAEPSQSYGNGVLMNGPQQVQEGQLPVFSQTDLQGQLERQAPLPSSTPSLSDANWTQLDSPLTVTNGGAVNNGVVSDGGMNSFSQNTFPQSALNDSVIIQDNGSGYVYSDQTDFWYDCDCDCRKCRRRHLFRKGGQFCWSCLKPELSGWLAGGVYTNAHGGNGSFGNSPLGFNNIDGFQFNQAWLSVDNEIQRGNGWDVGYHMDFLFGADGPDTQAFGDGTWDSGWGTSGQYGFAMPQLYFGGAYGNTSVVLGRFYTIIGYETVQAPDNFFYSKPYTFFYNEPFTHTGILATHDWSDSLTFYLGYTFGWDGGFKNPNDGATFLGGVQWAPSEYLSVFYSTSFGDPGDNRFGTSDTYLQSIVIDTMITDNLEWVIQSDYQNRQSAVLDGTSYGIANWLLYHWNDCTSFGLRYEWFRDSRGLAAVAGASEHFHAVTLGMNRRITDRFTVRPEARFDWADRDDAFAGAAFDSGTRDSQMTFGLQAIWTF